MTRDDDDLFRDAPPRSPTPRAPVPPAGHETRGWDDPAPAPAGAPPVLPVSRLVGRARALLERDLGLLWVSGEISNFTRAASGHCYFNLKDAQAQVRCVFFRTKAQFVPFALKDGLAVEVRATASIYEARGEFQLNVETMRLAGIGALYERFARLKARLEATGWFAAGRKRPLPAHPQRIGVVTSLHAAALRDVLTTLRRRMPGVAVVIYPTPVQGAGAAQEIAQAIALANARAEVDVLIVCRGGGSLEDLWAFNEEPVARAVYESTLVVVSGVGHETDFTICDFVADVRAPTPTAAAMLVTPDGAELRRVLQLHAAHWRTALRRAMEARMQRVDLAARRLTHPAQRLNAQGAALRQLADRLKRAWARHDERRHTRIDAATRDLAWSLRQPLPGGAPVAAAKDRLIAASRRRLDALALALARLGDNLVHLNPEAVLTRGYAIVATEDGRVVSAAAHLAPGDAVRLRFATDEADARVIATGPRRDVR